jgi:glycosyltransferase involved in cell wall biosynthesis
VNDLGISDHVLWTGFLGHEDKSAALGAADIFVLPSQSENFGIALLEAMAAGKACVTTSGVALGEEAAAAGAIRLSRYDAASLASTVADLLDSPDTRASLGCAAQALADAKYSLESMGAGLAALYSGIVR